jgi:hypothetical protein
MFIIESEDVTQGGYVEWAKYYRLRHLTTNWYLALDFAKPLDLDIGGADELGLSVDDEVKLSILEFTLYRKLHLNSVEMEEEEQGHHQSNSKEYFGVATITSWWQLRMWQKQPCSGSS